MYVNAGRSPIMIRWHNPELEKFTTKPDNLASESLILKTHPLRDFVVLAILWGCSHLSDLAVPPEKLCYQAPMLAGGNHPGVAGFQMSTKGLKKPWHLWIKQEPVYSIPGAWITFSSMVHVSHGLISYSFSSAYRSSDLPNSSNPSNT